MNELDEVWSQMLSEAALNAREGGRQAVAEYLALRTSNDRIRERGVRWLFDSMMELALEADRRPPPIKIERDDPHAFAHNGANMIGSRLIISQGVRCLTIEAGWTRTPSDGFMRGGALAAARITHFGMADADDLALRKTEDLPEWFSVGDGRADRFGLADLARHFDLFLGK